MITIRDLFNVQYLKAIAEGQDNLTPLDIKILYRKGITSMFFNPNIVIPKEILLKFVGDHYFVASERSFFLREDVQKNLNEVINVFIISFCPKWIEHFCCGNIRLASEEHIPEQACSALAIELFNMQKYGIKISDENFATLTRFQRKIEYFDEGRIAYENLILKM